MAGRTRAAMTPDMPATPGSDGVDLKRELKSFRAGLTTRDLVLATVVLGVVAVGVLVKALTGWPHFRIFGGTENMLGVLGVLGPTLVLALRFAIETYSGDDDLNDADDDGTGGASGQW